MSSDIIHHFFKVYLPSHSYHNLKIPKTFVQKMNGVVVPGGSILRDPLGRSWYMEVEKVEDAFYFQSGWREFVEANCLNLGDFMVFRFMGNSVFNVMVFCNSECEKNVIGEEEQEQEQELEQEQEQELEQEQEHEQEEEQQEHKEEEGYDFSSATYAVDEPMNPYFIASVKENRPYHLHIPKAVVDQNNISFQPRMILLDPNQNKQWPVRVCFRKDGRIIFTKGWWNFWTENYLTPHDKCIFEFKQDDESNVIKVKIVRAT